MIPWMLASSVALACDTPSTVADLRASSSAIEAAFAANDIAKADAAGAALDAAIPCLAEAVPADVVAVVHRAEGLRAFLDGDPNRAAIAFAAARSAIGSLTLPSSVPAAAAIQTVFLSRPARSATDTLPEPKDAWLQIDGTPSHRRPTEIPTLVQLMARQADGAIAVRETGLLWPGTPMLAYEAAPEVAVVAPPPLSGNATPAPPPMIGFDHSATPDLARKPASTGSHAGVGLGAGAGAAGITAAILGGLAYVAYDQANDPATGAEQATALRGRGEDYATAAIGLGMVSASFGVGAAVSGRF
jgi:hypothetical protein